MDCMEELEPPVIMDHTDADRLDAELREPLIPAADMFAGCDWAVCFTDGSCPLNKFARRRHVPAGYGFSIYTGVGRMPAPSAIPLRTNMPSMGMVL